MIQAAFIDMENMFELLGEHPEVKDLPEAPAIDVKHGAVEFRDVHFHYDVAYVLNLHQGLCWFINKTALSRNLF